MGIRQIRYCDITGTETDVDQHELHIDQMRIEIDLASAEYRRLLDALRPFIDAGRVEASAPDAADLSGPLARPKSRQRGSKGPTRSGLSADERAQLRQWAESKGLPVPPNNRFKQSLIAQWRSDTTPDTTATETES